VAPFAAGWEERREHPEATLREALKRGLGALLVPSSEGGAGLELSRAAEVFATLAAADFAFTFALVTHNNSVRTLARAGKLEPGLLNGSAIATFCLTEPGAGSDAAAIACRARRANGGWVLDGRKSWITNGVAADSYLVFAQTDASAGWRGIASFLVRSDNPGLEREPAYSLLGGHALGANGIVLRRCRVAAGDVLSPPGEGFKSAMAGIDTARVDVAAMCCAILRDTLERALAHVQRRHAFGQPLASFQGLQFQLVDVATNLEAAQLLASSAAAAVDAGRSDGPALASHAKKFATEVALPGIATCMQAMGAEGLKAEHPLGRHLAAAKIAQYLDGTTQVQNLVIGRSLGFTKP
jgi:alkylation response protein AidB-like acyl-CoA dehydrogenase